MTTHTSVLVLLTSTTDRH